MSQVISLNVAAIAAVAVAMAKQDVRYYLNGVCVDRDEAGRVTLVATNGHALVAASDPGMTWTGDTEREGKAAQLILPRDFVAAILKAAKGVDAVTLEYTPTMPATAPHVGKAWATVGRMVIHADTIDGRFPDWRAAMRDGVPAAGKAHGMAAFDPAVMGVALDAASAYRKAGGGSKRYPPGVHFLPAGEAATGFMVYSTGETELAGVVMPLRETGTDAETRATLERMTGRAPAADLAAA